MNNPFATELTFTRALIKSDVTGLKFLEFRITDQAEIDQFIFAYKTSIASLRTASGIGNFDIRKGAWYRNWYYTGPAKVVFAKIHFWSGVMTVGESKFDLRTKTNSVLLPNPSAATHSVTFYENKLPVMELRNEAPRGFFTNDTSCPMYGTIKTNITKVNIIAALLLYFQSSLEIARSHY